MKNFDDAFMFLLGNEGGFVDDPRDPGGATKWGITERVARKHGYQGKMQDFPLGEAKQIAKDEYWDLYECDKLPITVAFQVFDCAYNGGHPVQWLQKAVGVGADGRMGPATIQATAEADPYKTSVKFNSYRLIYMTQCKDWSTFSRGWASRIARNMMLGAD